MNQIFSVGEKVVALTNPENEECQPRVRGEVYKVLKLLYCSSCGCQAIHIGGKAKPVSCVLNDLIQCECGSKQPHNGFDFTDSIYFVRLEEISDAIAHFAEKEEYETCEMLKGVEEKMLVNKDVNKECK